MKGLVIVAKQRTGTNFLRSLIASSSNAHNVGEAFHTDTLGADGNFFTWMERNGRSYPLIRKDPEMRELITAWLDDLERDFPVPVLDLKYNSFWAVSNTWMSMIEMPPLLKVLHQRGYKFVHLTRANRLEHALSLVFARETGVYVTFQDVEINGKYTIDPEKLQTMCRQYEREIAFVNGYLRRLRRVEEMTYEDIHGADERVLRPVLRKLMAGTDIVFDQVGEAKTRKIVKNWRDNVNNVAEIEAAFGL
ncbi:hypothetical protein FDP22_06230 [Paroceanicella profunda]|uniref:Sulfotransferase family protein n=1 Tax=Paroceanicella profunda TaxID=2579971 RepID=A0A5B8FRQ5_9RHOB|nr:hypothetical protein [Paroceanicella profunda]QDL91416.1 hypothetical protein FDP22_06230 [Paroceanicella profunda]